MSKFIETSQAESMVKRMNEFDNCGAFKIPPRDRVSESKMSENYDISFENTGFAEIVIDGEARSTTPKYIPEMIFPVADEKHKVFVRMKQIARENLSMLIDHSKIFYLQAEYLKDFEDDYNEQASFREYYPYYRLMNYEQFRTYFTWRKSVRKGNIRDIPVSYAYIYIYELLNNIGVENPEDGMDKLLNFRESFKEYNKSIDKYLFRWIEEYYVYYGLAGVFKDFVRERGISAYYSDITEKTANSGEDLELFFSLSKYKIKRSAFYNEKTSGLIIDCLCFVIERLKSLFESENISFDKLVFYSAKNELAWTPFSDALFYPRLKQRDREVTVFGGKTYICRDNKWSCRTEMVTDSGKRLIGFFIKKTESLLRKAEGFKHKLSAELKVSDGKAAEIIINSGIPVEKAIENAVSEFYRERNKKIITVNPDILERVRQESSDIRDKLIVEESTAEKLSAVSIDTDYGCQADEDFNDTENECENEWAVFWNSLSETESEAVRIILLGNGFSAFCNKNGIMPEVLIDEINQKACDVVNDNITDGGENPEIYEEYTEKLKETAGIVNK